MASREIILAAIKENQPDKVPLPPDMSSNSCELNNLDSFKDILTKVGGTAVEVSRWDEVNRYIKSRFANQQRIISTLPELCELSEKEWKYQEPHSYENVDLAVISAHFGVAENAALWITDELMHQRVIPFICQNLAVVILAADILPTMHEAYLRIANGSYEFGTFVSGPSKTADIEQSLVFGAHGPKTLTVFLFRNPSAVDIEI